MTATSASASASASAPRGLRQRLGPWIDRFVRALGQPTIHVYPSGYVGTVSCPIEELEATLRTAGFSWDPVSTYHYTPEGSSADGSWVYRPSVLSDRQLHVVLFEQGRDRTDVYAHEEYSWLRHPVKHAREEDVRREAGVAATRRWFDALELAYDGDASVRRRLRHALQRLRERVGSRGRRVP